MRDHSLPNPLIASFVQSINCVNKDGTPRVPGEPILSDTFVKLQHQVTHKWLHAHEYKSPLTNQIEVCGLDADDSIWKVRRQAKTTRGRTL